MKIGPIFYRSFCLVCVRFVKDDLKSTVAEVVYGITLRLPGESFEPNDKMYDSQFVQHIRGVMQRVKSLVMVARRYSFTVNYRNVRPCFWETMLYMLRCSQVSMWSVQGCWSWSKGLSIESRNAFQLIVWSPPSMFVIRKIRNMCHSQQPVSQQPGFADYVSIKDSCRSQCKVPEQTHWFSMLEVFSMSILLPVYASTYIQRCFYSKSISIFELQIQRYRLKFLGRHTRQRLLTQSYFYIKKKQPSASCSPHSHRF